MGHECLLAARTLDVRGFMLQQMTEAGLCI